jgi:hypothetical protein
VSHPWRKRLRDWEPAVIPGLILAVISALVGNGPFAILVFLLLATVYWASAHWSEIRSARAQTIAVGALVGLISIGTLAGFLYGRRTEIAELRDTNARLRASDRASLLSEAILNLYGDRKSHMPTLTEDWQALVTYDAETATQYNQRYAAQAQAALKELAPYVPNQDAEKLKQLEVEAPVVANSLSVQAVGIGMRYLAERVR